VLIIVTNKTRTNAAELVTCHDTRHGGKSINDKVPPNHWPTGYHQNDETNMDNLSRRTLARHLDSPSVFSPNLTNFG
jgi:hypothetical protein